MRKLFLCIALLIAVPFVVRSQTMRMIPDSAYQGQQLAVTIVGSGTHFGSSNNASSVQVQVKLERSGNVVAQSNYASITNDSTISTSLSVGSSMLGMYDLEVDVTDTSVHTFMQSSAFKVALQAPSITSVSPSSAYDSQTVALTITGKNTSFLSGSSPTISFKLNGTAYFTAHLDSIYSNTSIRATVTVPVSSAPKGAYDVIVQNGTYSDTGKKMFVVLGAAPTTAHKPMKMTPDSGYQQQQLTVTIVGTGTHFGASNNASMSMVQVKLEHSGNSYADGYSVSVINDTTLRATFQLSAQMPVGSYYDLFVIANDTSQRTYIQDAAFHIVAPPASIVSVSPSSAYYLQPTGIKIGGQSTTFQNGSPPTITFVLNGAQSFSAQLDSIYSNTLIGANISVPTSAPAGVYDIIVSNGAYSDTGKKKFTVLGPMPSVTLAPDSGAASTMFNVSIVGQNTNFAMSNNASMPLVMNVDLKQNGISYYHTTADTVFSATLANALFHLPDSMQQGIYDAEISGNTDNGTNYDLHTTFLVPSHVTIQLPFRYSAKPADTVTIKVSGRKVHFINGSELAKIVSLVKGKTSIQAQNVNVTNDTTLFAFFSIPAAASPGAYDVDVVEPGTNRTVIGTGKFTVESGSGVSEIISYPEIINSISVTPNPAQSIASISFTTSQTSHVSVIIYDALGRNIATLCDQTIGTGIHNFDLFAADIPSGSYFYEIIAGESKHDGNIVVRH